MSTRTHILPRYIQRPYQSFHNSSPARKRKGIPLGLVRVAVVGDEGRRVGLVVEDLGASPLGEVLD